MTRSVPAGTLTVVGSPSRDTGVGRPAGHTGVGRPAGRDHGVHGGGGAEDDQAARVRVGELLESVGLSPASTYLDKLPHQLSGGQRQRVVTARALAPEPEILVADEPISMLDVSIRAEILQLLDALVRDRGIAMLYITHDLLSARLLADDVLVLHEGVVVERGATVDVVRAAEHSYTRPLLDAIPNPFAAHSSGATNHHVLEPASAHALDSTTSP